MSEHELKQKYYQPKPKTEQGFKEPVSWLGGRDMLAALKGIFVYSFFGEGVDPRPWMKPNLYPIVVPDDENQAEKAVDEFWRKRQAEYWNWKRERFEVWEEYFGKRENSSNTDEQRAESDESRREPQQQPEPEAFWFDYIADTGDGQKGVYGAACLCLSDLWAAEDKTGAKVNFKPADIEKDCLLPRGAFLFVGGDTAYHVADYSTIYERFQTPFRWAFASVREYMLRHYKPKRDAEKYFIGNGKTKPVLINEQSPLTFDEEWDGTLSKKQADEQDVFSDTEPLRPLFGVPANHDYYDNLDGFNRQFRRPPFKIVEENRIDSPEMNALPLRIPTFRREQEASYTALRLPFGWWFLGIDSENKRLDFRQRQFFKDVMEKGKPKKIIISTPEPTTVFGRQGDETDKTAVYLAAITKSMGLKQPFLNNGQFDPLDASPCAKKIEPGEYCRLDLSGDVHHYARYWGPENEDGGQKECASENYASVVAGGGGAFFDSTETLIGKSKVTKKGELTTTRGEIPPQVLFPAPRRARNATADRIFDLWNIRKGGYVQIAGAIIALIIFFLVRTSSATQHIHEFFGNISYRRISDTRAGTFAALALAAAVILFILSAISLHRLNARLKEARGAENSPGDAASASITRLANPLLFLIYGIIFYFLFFLPHWQTRDELLKVIHPFAQSFLLLLHFVCAAVLWWIAVEYSIWLIARFKLVRQPSAKPESWINLILSEQGIEKLERFLGEKESLPKSIWQSLRKQSVEKFPGFMLNFSAVGVMIFGIYLFGNESFLTIGADMLFMATILGGFFGLICLAVFVGGAYQRRFAKYIGFGLIGLWHFALQIFTLFILFYCDNWLLVLSVICLSFLTNGFSGAYQRLKFLFSDKDEEKSGWKKSLFYLTTIRPGAYVMKHGNAVFLAAVWVVYGLIVLAAPLLIRKYVDPNSIISKLPDDSPLHYTIISNFPTGNLFYWVLLLSLVAYAGYRISRVWFSWYLAVSLMFNGHNNEAGGAARIQDYKHILRIKVQENTLTVYVIGFDKAETELEKLSPQLFDRFELKCLRMG
jgi:hypothetical protein